MQLSANPPRHRRRNHRRGPALIAALIVCAVPGGRLAGQEPDAGLLPDSVMGGWSVFVEKQCLACHAVWGLGAEIGPDLGRVEHRDFTGGDLAGSLWNHVPKVYSHARQHQLEYPRLSEREMSDLYAFLFHVRYLDEPGDPEIGKQVLREKGCASCHVTEGALSSTAPDLRRWSAYTNPFVWAQKMWEHAPKMQEAMRDAGIAWPQLGDTDLMNIIAYLRSVGGPEAKVYLEPGSARVGARLFADRQCRSCHYGGGPGHDLAATAPPRSLAAIASRMWNHAPEMMQAMQARGVQRSPLTAQEMADIVAYVISLRYDVRGGDVQRGRAVFEDKGCVGCHARDEEEGAAAPPLVRLGAVASPVALAPALWNHGVAMMDRLSQAGQVWPMFERGEMKDMIAFLRSVAPAPPAPVARPPAPVIALPPEPWIGGPPITLDATCASENCHVRLIAERQVHDPAAQGQCTACHEPLDLDSHRFELQDKTSRLCYQCHDEPGQPAVVVEVCTVCHDPHSAENLLGPSFTGDEVCFDDMIGMTAALETIVHEGGEALPAPAPAIAEPPAAPALIAPTAQPTEAPVVVAPVPAPVADEITATGAVIPITIDGSCVTAECHAAIFAGTFKHGPTAQQQCDACHRLVDEPGHRFEIAAAEPDLCYECHDRPAEAEYVHGPVALGLCSSCHNPHSDAAQFMLPAAGSEFCYMCHSEMETHIQVSRVQHAVIEEEGCLACHDAHQADHKFQLVQDVPRLCFSCHESIAQIVEQSTVPHEPVMAERACANCHNPHGSDVPDILADVEMNVCLDCHDQAMETPHGVIIDMKAWIEHNPEHHGPIRDGNCSGCHQPHGSDHFRILQHEFPKSFYSPFSIDVYALCFDCHEETIVLDERTTTLTAFRNGDKNLHFVHVNQEKGRTCRACHEVHAGTKPKRIKDLVPFGNWAYPVNFELTEHGGKCTPGCHVARVYDRRDEITQE